ncbi:MAG: hypothetical protein ACK41W_07640 [Cyanobacteriota bacterium]
MCRHLPRAHAPGRFSGSPSQRDRRTMDGGFHDNSGAVTGQEILSALNKGLGERGPATKARVIPITIVNRSRSR